MDQIDRSLTTRRPRGYGRSKQRPPTSGRPDPLKTQPHTGCCRHVAYLLPFDGREVRASVVGCFHEDGRFSEEACAWTVRISDHSLRFASSGTLWSLEIDSDTLVVVRETSVRGAQLALLRATTAIYLGRDASTTSLSPSAWLKSKRTPPDSSNGHEQASTLLRDFFRNLGVARSEPWASNAVRLATSLVHDLPNASAVRAALVSNGIPLRLPSAPDFVAFEGDEWVRCLGWPVIEGRLRAPSAPASLVFEVVRLARTQGFDWPSTLGILILPPSATCLSVRIVDWRTDKQVLEDVESVAALVEKIQAGGRIEGFDGLMSGLAELASRAPSSHEVFRLRRLLEVAKDRDDPLLPGLASVLPDVHKLRNLIDHEVEELRRTLLGELAMEVEAERVRGSNLLDDLRTEIADAERSAALLRAREEAYHRVADELRAEMSDKVDRRIGELASTHENCSAALLATVETNCERLEMLVERVGAIEDDLRLREHIPDVACEALQDERTLGVPAERVNEPVLHGDGGLRDSEADSSPEMLVSDPTAARASLRWHAHENGLEEMSLHTGFAISAVGLLPVFIGATASSAAIALARAIGGSNFSMLHCDPTLIAASDLLDPKRARTDVLLAAIEAAKRKNDRWHAVVLVSIDWAPCAYWLAALAADGPGLGSIPHNLLVVGAAAADGPRTTVPLSALRSAVPIRVGKCLGLRRGVRPTVDGWSTSIVTATDGGDDEQSDAQYRTEIIELLGIDLSAASLRLIVGSARAGSKVLLWTVEEASAALSFAAEWLAAARDGATLTPVTQAAIENFISRDET